MTGVATYAIPPTFLGAARRDPAAPICVAGIPLDLGTTNRSGARFGPGAIRQASRMLVDGEHPQHGVDTTKLPLADIGDFTPGTVYRVGQLPGGTFGTFICYEAIFPNEIRHFAGNGAELLINMSNDGWFGRSAAPAQHVMMARVRAVESRRWLLRDTNNGFTADFDPYGRMVAQLPTDIRGELDAPYDFRSDLTLYTRFGDWLAWLCIFTSVALLAMTIATRRNSGESPS